MKKTPWISLGISGITAIACLIVTALALSRPVALDVERTNQINEEKRGSRLSRAIKKGRPSFARSAQAVLDAVVRDPKLRKYYGLINSASQDVYDLDMTNGSVTCFVRGSDRNGKITISLKRESAETEEWEFDDINFTVRVKQADRESEAGAEWLNELSIDMLVYPDVVRNACVGVNVKKSDDWWEKLEGPNSKNP